MGMGKGVGMDRPFTHTPYKISLPIHQHIHTLLTRMGMGKGMYMA